MQVLLAAAVSMMVGNFPEIRLGESRNGDSLRDSRLVSMNNGTTLFGVPNAKGTGYQTIIGSFETTLSGRYVSSEATTEEELTEALVAFINTNRDLLGLAETFRSSYLSVKFTNQDGKHVVVEYDQVREGIAVKKSGLVANFLSNGDLYSLSGDIIEQTSGTGVRGHVKTPAQALALATAATDVDCGFDVAQLPYEPKRDLAKAEIRRDAELVTQ